MKIVLLFFLLPVCFFFSVKAQTTSYIGGTIEYSVNDRTKPLGKNVTVKYDSFYKSYFITYKDINGITCKMIFEYNDDGIYTYDGVEYSCLFCEAFLSYSKNGNGMITFSDFRKRSYGGTGKSYSVKNLSFSK